MKEMLWISLRAPYDNVPHGGGKTHNFYVKGFHASQKCRLHLLTFCYEQELEKIDLDAYGISSSVSVIKRNERMRNILGRLGLPISLLEYRFVVSDTKHRLKQLRMQNYRPDVVLLQWTEIVMLSPYVKKCFPYAKIVCIEEDVTFLKLNRKYQAAQGIKKLVLGIQRLAIEKREVKGLLESDLAVLNNHKDYELVLSKGIDKDKVYETSPYFEDMSMIKRCPEKGNIIFWGAMNRPENIEAVRWFVDNVYGRLDSVRFIVVGARPSAEILDLQKKGIVVTGFVEDPKEYFEKCMCMVVPLQMGAGIKIKVLEGMSAGIPVLTNQIGIEGICACAGKDYLHCETSEEYADAIKGLMADFDSVDLIGKAAAENMKTNYSIQRDIEMFIKRVVEL